MSISKKELLKHKEEMLGKYLQGVLEDIEIRNTLIGEFSQGTSTLLDSLHTIGQINRQEFQRYRIEFQKSLLHELQKKDNYGEKLLFIYEQIQHLQINISDAKIDNNSLKQMWFETMLDTFVLPLKEPLIELVRLENEVGPLKKILPQSIQVFGSLNDITPDILPAQIEEKDETETIMTPEISEEVFIPISIIDQPLETQTGKPLNNATYIATGRKFTWSDERIPDLISLFLLESNYIFDYQLKHVQDFFSRAKSGVKIVFDGNANVLTTLLYDLLTNNYLTVSIDFLAERVAYIFVRKDESTRPLTTKNTLKTSLKPANNHRRIKKGISGYPEIIGFLQKRLIQHS